MNDSEDNIESFSSILVFVVAEKEYCIHLNDVLKIVKRDELTLPVMQEENTAGSIIMDNNKYVKINLYKYLGLKRKNESKNSRIILAEINGKIFGFSVEKIKEIISINAALPVYKIEGSHRSSIKGKINVEDKSLLVIDLAKIRDQLENNNILI